MAGSMPPAPGGNFMPPPVPQAKSGADKPLTFSTRQAEPLAPAPAEEATT
jgi:hypothetical protein